MSESACREFHLTPGVELLSKLHLRNCASKLKQISTSLLIKHANLKGSRKLGRKEEKTTSATFILSWSKPSRAPPPLVWRGPADQNSLLLAALTLPLGGAWDKGGEGKPRQTWEVPHRLIGRGLDNRFSCWGKIQNLSFSLVLLTWTGSLLLTWVIMGRLRITGWSRFIRLHLRMR